MKINFYNMNKQAKKGARLTALALAALLALTACGSADKKVEESSVTGRESVIIDQYISSPETGEAKEEYMMDVERAEPSSIAQTTVVPINPGDELIHNTESYERLDENRFMRVADQPLSTFAADVDTASYANIRRFINQGSLPNKDAVRIEEMLNYFSYDYPKPKEGEPFSVTMEMGQTPWNEETKLLMVGLKAEDPLQNNRPASNLVFLIDVSGSMEGADRLDLVKRAYLTLLDQLGPEDKITIVTYASSDAVVLEGASLDNKAEIMTAIENLTAGGSTHGSAGITTAYQLAEKYFIKGGNNRIILATDGDLNVGLTSEGDLIDLVNEKRQSGVFLSVLAFGYGNYKDDKLEALADNGNGQLSYIDDIAEARKVLSDELGSTLFTVAKDVKLQVDFNPEYVKGYRLIGYENRVMAAEDFDDDTKDGGELGAGHRVTALYEIVEADSDFEIPSVGSKYQKPENAVTGEDNGEMLTVNIRYKKPDEDTSTELNYPLVVDGIAEPSKNHRLSSAIAAFGMILKESEYKGTADLDMVASILEELKSDDPYVIELLQMVQKAKTLPPSTDRPTTINY